MLTADKIHKVLVGLAGGPSGAQRNSLRAISPHSLKCLRTISSVSSLLPASVIRPTYNLRPENPTFQSLRSVRNLTKLVLLTFGSVFRNYQHHPCRPDSRRVFLGRSSRARYPGSDVLGEGDDGGIYIRAYFRPKGRKEQNKYIVSYETDGSVKGELQLPKRTAPSSKE
jgi:hypothetical protein